MPVSLSADDAVTFLRERGHDAKDLAPLAGGLWSTTYAFWEGLSEYVVRFHERRDDLEKDRLAERWRSRALRMPHMIEIGDHGSGGYGIADRVAGRPMDDLDESGLRQILPSLFAALDAIRDADLAGTEGFGLWHGDGRAPHRSWRDALSGDPASGDQGDRAMLLRSPVGVVEFDAGLARMRELLPAAPEERYLVHNDLLHYNVLVDGVGVILLDWGASIFGDFLYDAALLTFWWPWFAGRWGGIDIRGELARHHARSGAHIPSFAERLRLCELDIGVSHILYQARRGERANSAWTAARTLALSHAPLS